MSEGRALPHGLSLREVPMRWLGPCDGNVFRERVCSGSMAPPNLPPMRAVAIATCAIINLKDLYLKFKPMRARQFQRRFSCFTSLSNKAIERHQRSVVSAADGHWKLWPFREVFSAAIPLTSSPLASSPLASSPLASSPLASSPLALRWGTTYRSHARQGSLSCRSGDAFQT
jgi:hypothetical protein